jgi:hypothetical protein
MIDANMCNTVKSMTIITIMVHYRHIKVLV